MKLDEKDIEYEEITAPKTEQKKQPEEGEEPPADLENVAKKA